MNKIQTRALEIISKHKGKKAVYESYLKRSPELAEKYLDFIGKNTGATYIKYDERLQRFVG